MKQIARLPARSSRRSPSAAALWLATAGLLPAVAGAMQQLSEDELSGINAQDGLEYQITSPSLSLAEWRVDSDGGATAGGLRAYDLRMVPNGGATALNGLIQFDTGATSNTELAQISYNLNINRFRLGGPGTAGFRSGIAGDATRTFGEWAMISDVVYRVVGKPFYGNPASTSVYLAFNDAELYYRQNWGYHANITLDNVNFLWNMPAGTADFDAQGLRLAGDTTFRIGFDLLYKFHPDQDLTTITANDRPLARINWGGMLYDAQLNLRGGGLWNTAADAGTRVAYNAGGAMVNLPTSGRTEGVSVGMRWNYRSAAAPATPGNFLWSIGHTTGDQEYIEFGDWKNLESATGPVSNRYGFDFPMIAVDVLNAGSTTNAGGSLCWGGTQAAGSAACTGGIGTLINLTAGTVAGFDASLNRTGGGGYVQLVRNGNLLAWSNRVRVMRNSPTPQTQVGNYDWGLIYTLANINGNTYIYPGGSESDTAGGSRNQGALIDLVMMTQTPDVPWAPNNTTATDRWTYGSHFMIADTAAQMGIGFLGSSVLLVADDLRIWLKNTWAGQTYPNNFDGGIDMFSPRTRYHFKGLFGGARLPNGHDLVKGANIELNLEGVLNYRLSPPPTRVNEAQDFIGFSAALRLRCGTTSPFGCASNAFSASNGLNVASGSGSFIAIEEPGYPGVALRFADLSGDLAITQGALQIRTTEDVAADSAPGTPAKTDTTRPELVISQKILVGASAAARLNDGTIGYNLAAEGGAAGRALTTNAQFGNNHMLSWAIPAGSIYSSFTLKPQ